MGDAPRDMDALIAKGQQTLIAFLDSDIDIAHTFLKTAQIEADIDPPHSQWAVDKAKAALEAVRRFQHRIVDPRNGHASTPERANSSGLYRGRLNWVDLSSKFLPLLGAQGVP